MWRTVQGKFGHSYTRIYHKTLVLCLTSVRYLNGRNKEQKKRTVYGQAIDPESKFTGTGNKYDLLFTREYYFQVFNLCLTLHKLQQ